MSQQLPCGNTHYEMDSITIIHSPIILLSLYFYVYSFSDHKSDVMHLLSLSNQDSLQTFRNDDRHTVALKVVIINVLSRHTVDHETDLIR